MADGFNPYHVWLGIRPEEQPANHYRLLSLRLFESSADVIDNAADRQMAHLRTIQVGKHVDLSQRLLNEVAAARICLLDPKKRAAYDQQLRAKLAAASPATASGAEPHAAGGSAIQRQPPRRATGPAPASPMASIPTAAPLPQQPTDPWDNLLGQPDVKSPSGSGSKSAKSAAAKRGANNRNMMIGIGVAVALVAMAGIGLLLLNGSSSDGTLVFNWPAAYRTDTNVSIDGVPVAIPTSGPWEYRCPAGSHRIVADRLAYKLDTHVDLAAGSQQPVPADWKPKAMLVLSWPPALRIGAELKIDGRPQIISQHDPLEVPIEPGRRTIVITRRGYDPIHTTATVAADGRELVSIAAPPTTAKLVFDWPAAERKDAELIVDGQSQTVAAESNNAPFELTLPSGQHVVHITRTGFEPFNQAVDLSAGTDNTIKPTWTPEKKIVAAPAVADTPVPVETTASQPAKKLPIPTAAEQEKIAKQLNELYKTSQPGPKDPAKAQGLYDVAAKDGSSPNERYMLLMKGAEIAATAGDLNLSLQGIDTLDADYDIDALEAKQKLLERFIAAGKPDQVAIAIPTAEQLVDQAVAADRYDIAVVLATTASKAVAKSKIATHKEDEDRLSRRRHDIHLLEPIYAAAKKAQETLDKNSADAEANLTVGRWLCFYKGDWTTGLPMLARGSDEKLKALAEQEINSPTDADQQVQLADVWWDLAQKEAGIARDSLHLHAGNIYQEAMPNLPSALKKATIDKRLAEIAASATPKFAPAPHDTDKPIGSAKFTLNKWVDVLRLVDTTRDRIDGDWTRHGQELTCRRGVASRIAFPVDINGSYDLEVEFTRTAGRDDVAAMLSTGSHGCMVVLGAWSASVSGLMNVDGRDARDSHNPFVMRPGVLENDHRYRLLISDRILGDDRASIDVSLDGKRYVPHWEGNPAALSYNPGWTMPNSSRVGLGVMQSEVTFHSARLRLVSGHATLDPAVAESLSPKPAPATVVSEKPSGPPKFPLNKWVDVLRFVDATRDRVNGTWTRNGAELSCASGSASRIELPVVIDGGYDLGVEFTRSSGSNFVVTMLSVGSHSCMLGLSGWDGEFSGLMNVNGHEINDAQDPAAVRPGKLENGRRYQLLISVRILKDGRASVDVALDGNRFLPHWEGEPADLSVHPYWVMPHQKRLGLGATNSEVTFHSARLKMVSGHASLDPKVAEASPSQLVREADRSESTLAAGKLPVGKEVDLLANVDTDRDTTEGHWTRQRDAIVSDNSVSKIAFPVSFSSARYELRVVFSRDKGDDCVVVNFPVGDTGCSFMLANMGGQWSGLEVLDGKNADGAANPTARSPSALENGHHYVVRIVVKTQRGIAEIHCFLDDKELVNWTGNTSSLSQRSGWKMPLHNVGFIAWQSPSTVYSATVRGVK
jgi:hypothetical protein